MTDKQKISFRTLLNAFLIKTNRDTKITFNHGDCFGADADAHGICREALIRDINCYPCNLSNQRAFTDAKQIGDPLPPLERNRIIADGCDVLIACPATGHEEQRSGTWATIRHRDRMQGRYIIIWPDGSIGEDFQ